MVIHLVSTQVSCGFQSKSHTNLEPLVISNISNLHLVSSSFFGPHSYSELLLCLVWTCLLSSSFLKKNLLSDLKKPNRKPPKNTKPTTLKKRNQPAKKTLTKLSPRPLPKQKPNRNLNGSMVRVNPGHREEQKGGERVGKDRNLKLSRGMQADRVRKSGNRNHDKDK